MVESLISRRRCSTPISSASSASIADGTCRNVLRVSVPSYTILGSARYMKGTAHIFDLLDGEICVRWDSNGLWSDIDDDHHRSGNKSFEELVDLLVGSSKFRPCVIPPDHPFTSCEMQERKLGACCFKLETFSDSPFTFLNISHIPSM